MMPVAGKLQIESSLTWKGLGVVGPTITRKNRL